MTFQAGKSSTNFYCEIDNWFFQNFQGHKLYDVWQAGVNYATGKIDPKYFNKEFGKPVGFVGFLSPFYCIGDAVATENKKISFPVEIKERF